jgi:hypothetical protein
MTKDAYTFRYHIRNWSHYNQALIARGGITFWIDEAALTTWRNTQAGIVMYGRSRLSDDRGWGLTLQRVLWYFAVHSKRPFKIPILSWCG